MRILAVDYGDARTGLASCDVYESIASPVGTICEWNTERLIEKIAAKAVELGSELIVVGLPINMDGTKGERAQKCSLLGEKLSFATGLEVVLRDERVTTVQAIGILNQANVRGRKRKAVVDTVAATLILEEYLEYRKKNKAQNS